MASDCPILSDFKKQVFQGDNLLLFLVIIISFSLRLNGIGDHSLWIDEAGTASLVENYLSNGFFEYPSGVESDRSKPFFIITALFVSIFSMSEFALRLPSAIIGVLTIILVYKWSKELFDFYYALIPPIVLSLSSWHIAMSQNARMYVLFQLLYLAVFYCLYKKLKTESSIYILICAFAALTSIFTHVTGYILLLTAPLSFYLFSDRKLGFDLIKSSILFVFVGLVAITLSYDLAYLLGELKLNPYSGLEHTKWLILNMPVVLILSVLGLIQVSKKDYNLFYLFVLAILPPAAVYFLFIEPSASRYLFYAYPFLALLIPYAFKYLEEKFDAGFSDKYISAFIVSILLFSLGNPLNPELGSNSPQPDFESAYSMVESQSEDEEVLIAGRPLAANYYFRNPDYVLIETFYVNESTKNGSEHFSGSPTILNATNFNRILSNHDSGWVVATEAVQKGIDEDLLHEIEKLELKMEGRKIKVWRFEQ